MTVAGRQPPVHSRIRRHQPSPAVARPRRASGAAGLRREAGPGIVELRAAAIMVSEGHARRVTLSGFTGPALVGEAARLSRLYGLSIDFAIRPDRRFDLVVSRGRALGG